MTQASDFAKVQKDTQESNADKDVLNILSILFYRFYISVYQIQSFNLVINSLEFDCSL